jgi:hypothetical protein
LRYTSQSPRCRSRLHADFAMLVACSGSNSAANTEARGRRRAWDLCRSRGQVQRMSITANPIWGSISRLTRATQGHAPSVNVHCNSCGDDLAKPLGLVAGYGVQWTVHNALVLRARGLADHVGAPRHDAEVCAFELMLHLPIIVVRAEPRSSQCQKRHDAVCRTRCPAVPH